MKKSIKWVPKSVVDLTVLQYFHFVECVRLLSENSDVGEVYSKMSDIFPTVDIYSLPVLVGKTKEVDAAKLLAAVMYEKKAEVSLLGLFTYIDTLIKAYKPGEITDTSYTYASVEYKLNNKVCDMALLRVAPIKAGELVTYQELRRSLSNTEGITDTDYDFSLTVRTLALLFIKGTEEVPLLVAERYKWLDARAAYFEAAPATLALWVKFFFTQQLMKSYITAGINPYLRDSLPATHLLQINQTTANT